MSPQRCGGSTVRSRPATAIFVNDPQNGHMTSTATTAGTPGVAGRSLAKYYQYSDIKPGVFGNVWLSAGTKDGLYQFDFVGKNIGYDDQSYWLGASKAGQFYFNFSWDQSPHLYSTSAYTPYVLNGNALTLNSCAKTATNALGLATCATPTDIGIKRDTASGDVRWTPDDAWDIRADYSHMARTGTQVGSVFGGVTATSQITETGRRRHAELRFERRICRHVALGPTHGLQAGL